MEGSTILATASSASFVGPAAASIRNESLCDVHVQPCYFPIGEHNVLFAPVETSHGWEAVTAEISCSAYNCTCKNTGTCRVESDVLVVFAQKRLEEDEIRLCLAWDVTRVADLDLQLGFNVGDGSTCKVSTFAKTCGNVSLAQWNDDVVLGGKEGILISTVYQTTYTVSIRNYLESAATESSGLSLTVDGFGIAQPLDFKMPASLTYYDSWPEGGSFNSGMFR